MKTMIQRSVLGWSMVLGLSWGGLNTIPMLAAQEPDALSIIRKAEDRMRGETSISTMRISIVRPKWTRDMELKSWTRGDTYSLSLVTAPARDKGTVFLRRDKEVWNWVPSVERVIKLPPSMMSQSWMGTDLTNDDLVKQSDLKNDFKHSLLGKESVSGQLCYKISSIPGEDAAVVWGKIIHWISVEDYIQMKAEFYDEDGYLVNTFIADRIQQMGGKKIASRLEIIPADKPGNKTVLEYLSLEFNKPLSEDFFTTQNMKRIK